MASSTIERPAGLEIPERRELAATFLKPPEIRDSAAGDGWQFTGHAAVWNRLSLDLGGFRERIQKGAFAGALADPEMDVTLVADHNMGALTTLASTRGRTLELSEDARGLRTSAKVAPTSAGADLRVLMQRGDVQGMSFGFTVAAGGDSWAMEDGEMVRTIRKIRALYDVSIVSFPAYPQTDVAIRGLLVDHGPRLALFDAETGDVNPAAVERVRLQIEARKIELNPSQQLAFQRAQTLLGAQTAGRDESIAAEHRRNRMRLQALELEL